MSVEKLFDGDQRLESLAQFLIKEIYERAHGLPIPSVVGVLEIVKQRIMKDSDDE